MGDKQTWQYKESSSRQGSNRGSLMLPGSMDTICMAALQHHSLDDSMMEEMPAWDRVNAGFQSLCINQTGTAHLSVCGRFSPRDPCSGQCQCPGTTARKVWV